MSQPSDSATRWRVAFVTSHPVPYHVPTYRALAARPEVELEVLFTHNHGVRETFDAGFGRAVRFDVPLLEGYAHRFPKNLAPNPGFSFFGQVNPEILVGVAAGRYDAVIVHGYANLTTLAALTQPRASRTKVLLRSETTLLNPRPLATRVAKQALVRALFKRVDHFLAIGACSRKYFEAYGVPADQISVAPYSVDNGYFEDRSASARRDPSAARQKLGLPADDTLFLYCSKIVRHKRPLDVLHAFAKGCGQGPAALAYVGDGAQLPELRAEIDRLGLGQKVHLLGFRNQSELPEIYGAADIFVQASEREPWGMVVNEAMACGAAVCASDQVGSAYDLVQENGATFPVGGIETLAALMSRWMGDRAEVARMKAASLARIRQWSPQQTAEGIVSGLGQVLGRA